MFHRAILGSFERFIGILIENYSGNLPLWLAPTQVTVCSITDEADDYVKEISEMCLVTTRPVSAICAASAAPASSSHANITPPKRLPWFPTSFVLHM